MDKTFFKIFIVITVFWNIYGCGKPEICMTDIKSDFVMTESLAISLSRQALINKGIDISKVEPIPYRPKTSNKVFARNAYDHNSGYVLWQVIDDNTTSYSISIRIEGDKIYCNALKSH